MNAILKADTGACLAHLNQSIDGDEYLAKRQVIADFTGVKSQTVRRWFVGEIRPIGESLIRLRFLLEFLGYDVEELRPLDPAVRNAGRAYAFRTASIEDLARHVGYPDNRKGIDTLLATLRGARGASPERLARFEDFASKNEIGLAEAVRSTPNILGINARPEPRPSRPAALPPRLAAQQPQGSRQALIESFGAQVKALLPLARELESDEYTPEDRAKVRELAGGDGVFRLANMLHRLCSERSRRMQS